MKISRRSQACIKTPLHGILCITWLLTSCGQEQGSKAQSAGRTAAEQRAPTPLEAYEELLAKRLGDVEQLAALLESIGSRESGMNVIAPLCELMESQRAYDEAYAQMNNGCPDIKARLKKENPAFKAMLVERANAAYGRIMDSLIKIRMAGYYGSAKLKQCLNKYGLCVTDRKMASYLNSRMVTALKNYLEQYEAMVAMMEQIENKSSADACASSLPGRMLDIRTMVADICRLEQTYAVWLPALEQNYRMALDELRRKAALQNKRAFRVVVKLASTDMHGSAPLRNIIAGMDLPRPQIVEFQEPINDPVLAMEQYCVCLENIKTMLESVTDAASADKQALHVAEAVSQLKRMRECVLKSRFSVRDGAARLQVQVLLSNRALKAEAAVNDAVAQLKGNKPLLQSSPLLSNALALYHHVMETAM